MRLVLRFWYWINSFTQLIVFFILITYLVDIVKRNSILVTHGSLIIIIIIIIIIITNFYTGLKNPSVCNTVVLGVLSKIINK